MGGANFLWDMFRWRIYQCIPWRKPGDAILFQSEVINDFLEVGEIPQKKGEKNFQFFFFFSKKIFLVRNISDSVGDMLESSNHLTV